MTTEKHRCAGKVSDNRRSYPCASNGRYEEEGRWWCGVHAPSKVSERYEKKRAKWADKRSDAKEIEAYWFDIARQLERRLGLPTGYVYVNYDRHSFPPRASGVVMGPAAVEQLQELGIIHQSNEGGS